MRPLRVSRSVSFRFTSLTMWLALGLLALSGRDTIAQRPGQLLRRVAADAGSADAPLLFCVGVHIEPFGAEPSAIVGNAPRPSFAPSRPDYNNRPFFEKHVEDLRLLVALVEKHGGKLTVQAQTPFTRAAAESGLTLFADLEKRGHEVALHFHEDAHLGRGCDALPVEKWAAVMKEEIDWLKKAGATRVRYWSGGNLYANVLEAASRVGLDVMSDYKNPRTQNSDERLMGVAPWRPSAGPRESDVAAFAKHSPSGKIVYLPDGIFGRVDFNSMRRAMGTGGDYAYFDSLTDGLERSLRAARKDRMNVFHITVHAGEFRGGPFGQPFAVIDRWLTEIVDPLVKAGKIKWATFSQMADGYAKWEKANPGVDPRSGKDVTPAKVSPARNAAPPTFFAVHCEAHSANPPMWDALTRFVDMADGYGAKLTLMFNPQWVEFIVPDKSRFERVKAWQKNGHEVALHYHTIRHNGWCGYTNRSEWKATPRYRGTVADMMKLLQQLAAPDRIVTACCGIDVSSTEPPRSASADAIVDATDFPDEIIYDVDGIVDGLAKPLTFTYKDKERVHLRHLFLNPRQPQTLQNLQATFDRAQAGEVLGVVTHEMAFAFAPTFVEQWFQFLQTRGAKVRTVRDIAGQKEKQAGEALRTETPVAENRSAPHGYVTFALNVHDTRYVNESADTVLRFIEIFQKYKVRGDFYLTAPKTEMFVKQRPDVIAALKESGMTISYHVRPPHPIYAGFDARLRNLDDEKLAAAVRDYETYHLDLTTGDLQRDQPGGYSYVAKVFGRHPVVVSPQSGDPRIRAAALKVYTEMGARMAVLYHESGTKLEQPFEWSHGLLARPSDFSVTRWALPGEPRESFWWNRLDSPQATEFNPTTYLKKRLADWSGSRPPFITALIHENNFYRFGPEAWQFVYTDPQTRRPLHPPYDLNAPDRSRLRSPEEQERIWKAYEELVAYAAAHLRVVTSEDIVAMAEKNVN